MLKYVEKFNIRHYGMNLIGNLHNFSVTDVDGQNMKLCFLRKLHLKNCGTLEVRYPPYTIQMIKFD